MAELTDSPAQATVRPLDTDRERGPQEDAPREPQRGLYGKTLALPKWRMTLARAISVVALAVGALYLHWRISTLPGTGVLGLAFYGAEVVNYLGLTLAVFLLWRARWRTGPAAPPVGTLDVFIPVCGEPVEMVEETLRAALAIAYPHQTYVLNDGRIAGKPNWRDIEDLAARYGVECFTRTSGAPGKGGNLNHALARTSGEFVATIDADHVAVPQLAHETLGYFANPDVAFVSTPQQFKGDDDDFLNNRELLYYRYMAAAKDADNSVQTYGNGVYRRAALESIGGFSEWVRLCEDLHTCYRLHALGWKGVYHPRAVTTGLAPETAAALVKQRLTWATDSLQIFFRDNPLIKRGLTLRQRLHYFQTTSHYLLACSFVIFMLGPPLWLLWRIPVMRPNSVESYLVHVLAYFGVCFLWLAVYGGLRGAIRIIQANLYLPPVFVIAAFRVLSRMKIRPAVTEKTRPSRFSGLLLPQQTAFVLNAVAIVVALIRPVPARHLVGAWAGYMVFALAGFMSHVTPRPVLTKLLRVGSRGAVAVAVAVLLLLLPDGSFDAEVPWVLPQRWNGPLLALAAPSDGAYLGVFNPDLLSDDHAVEAWARAHGTRPGIVHWYQQWFSGHSGFRADWLERVRRQGAVPMISWEPWAKPGGTVHATNQPNARLALIASGRYDEYVRAWARAARDYGRPILLRPMHLMNGDWYPWSVRTNGNSERDFVAAWRHLHNVFVQEGAHNVGWVWSINSFAGLQGDNRDLREYYPGDRYVDWVAMSGFNWGDATEWGSWRSVDEVFGETYSALAELGKPVMIAEIGTVSSGGDAPRWIEEGLTRLRDRYPLVKAVVWFDAAYDAAVDFRLSGAARAAFNGAAPTLSEPPRSVRATVASGRYSTTGSRPRP